MEHNFWSGLLLTHVQPRRGDAAGDKSGPQPSYLFDWRQQTVFIPLRLTWDLFLRSVDLSKGPALCNCHFFTGVSPSRWWTRSLSWTFVVWVKLLQDVDIGLKFKSNKQLILQNNWERRGYFKVEWILITVRSRSHIWSSNQNRPFLSLPWLSPLPNVWLVDRVFAEGCKHRAICAVFWRSPEAHFHVVDLQLQCSVGWKKNNALPSTVQLSPVVSLKLCLNGSIWVCAANVSNRAKMWNTGNLLPRVAHGGTARRINVGKAVFCGSTVGT